MDTEGRESQVRQEVNNLINCVTDLHGVVDAMRDRISRVLITNPKAPREPDETERDSLVPLAAELRGVGADLRFAVDELANMKDRIEL